ncbi:DUF6876 family protein [Leeuwenhoekiella sp.]|uniref:DUF6876 family protein n=2 Tax=Leeuwenhoekiella TaxID=283735 RepID=UPI000C46F6E6|nr:DUF6876 family protein [Leeuwenhoekiella sp.]MAW93872.1 hypothetical protein [Leeuwenhoekiella sp.]MAW95629.1 hypothetical protein [Leeuwenhoekiella sp.]MBA82279.1 hypothetical protein [Leeuwenhoekiella sp.]|tara:strand:+ start:263 stop:607 length:345 start_codon:yes stop_codon:yes gene_type:complete
MQFYGSEVVYTLPLFNYKYTEGIHFLAEQATCYWMLTDIGAVVRRLRAKHGFIVVLFKRYNEAEQQRTHHEAVINYGDGNGITLFEQQYTITDFPLDELHLFFVDDTLMLPNEY